MAGPYDPGPLTADEWVSCASWSLVLTLVGVSKDEDKGVFLQIPRLVHRRLHWTKRNDSILGEP